MRVAFWIPEATNTHLEYVLLTVFTRVIHAIFLTIILYLNLGCVIYAVETILRK